MRNLWELLFPPASPEGEADPPAMPEQGDGGQVAGRQPRFMHDTGERNDR